ncbi:signal peptide, CUB and EGF-like domain-containing protein 1, partial [Orbicella faveolata]|uniref:signal peptide, CUB and EGF-like domain-containing protein 1 n=1 Tax=Orbicella faveolata TaxID=48498 RepID=UPI0009E588EE
IVKNACGNNPPCLNNAICQSGFTDKGYRCLCYPGFKGEYCDKDINECSSAAPYCSADATCHNTIGSYQCRCKQGFSGDGKECKDIDECAIGTYDCSSDAICINTKGSFNCTCKTGFYGDGKNCSIGDHCYCIHDFIDEAVCKESNYCGV